MAAKLGYTQTDRALKIDTPLGADKLLLRGVAGQEAISQLFRFQLDLISEDDAIPFDGIVGKNVTLHLEIADGERTWNGFISRFSQGSREIAEDSGCGDRNLCGFAAHVVWRARA